MCVWALKVTSQVATAGAETAVYDCLVRIVMHIRPYGLNCRSMVSVALLVGRHILFDLFGRSVAESRSTVRPVVINHVSTTSTVRPPPCYDCKSDCRPPCRRR